MKPILKALLYIYCLVWTGFIHASETQCDGIFGHEVFLKQRQAYDEKHQHIAQDMYLYAQISYNSYQKVPLFNLPENIRLLKHITHKDTGFSAFLYEKTLPNNLRKQLIIAFTGTQNWRDWLYGNIRNHQYLLAETLIQALLKEFPQHFISVTGHSLGGGIALHSSLRFEGIPAFVFNPSYRTHVKGKLHTSQRIVIAEQGDILKLQRLSWPTPPNLESFESFYCAQDKDHSMYKLARCLTHIAAIELEEAETSLLINRDENCE